MVIVEVDGSSLQNGGPSATGVVVFVDEIKICSIGTFVGNRTNNEVEYIAVIHGIEEAIKTGEKVCLIKSDSMLVVNQLHGKYQTNDPRFIRMQSRIYSLTRFFDQWSLKWIPREQNEEANYVAQKSARSKRNIVLFERESEE